MKQSTLKITLNPTGDASIIKPPELGEVPGISEIESADSFDLNDIERRESEVPSQISDVPSLFAQGSEAPSLVALDSEELKLEEPSPPAKADLT